MPSPPAPAGPPAATDSLDDPPTPEGSETEVHERGIPVGPLTIVVVGVVAAVFDVAIRQPLSSIAHAGLVTAASVAVLVTRDRPPRAAVGLALAAPVVGLWLAIRTSPGSVVLDATVAWALVWASAAVEPDGSLTDMPARALWRPARRAAGVAATLPFDLRATVRASAWTGAGVVGGILNGSIIAVPLVVGLGWLLTQGDRAFSELLGAPSVASAPEHFVVLTIGAALTALLVGRNSRGDDAHEPRRLLGATEALVVSGALALLFATYVATVGVTASLGADAVIDDPAETARWARSGFFQLLWVAGVALFTVVNLDARSQSAGARSDRWLTRLLVADTALTVVIVGLAVHRLANYAEAYGLTLLRVHTIAVAIWLGFVVACVGLRRVGLGRRRRWIMPAGVTGVLLGVLVLNAVNVEARIVDWNVDHAGDVERFDARYLVDGLGDDAVPTLSDRLDELDDDTRSRLVATLCVEFAEDDGDADGLAWNLGRHRARARLAELC